MRSFSAQSMVQSALTEANVDPRKQLGVRVHGKERLIANVGRIRDETLTRLIAAINRSLQITQMAAQTRAPKRTGALRAGIKLRRAKLYRSGNWRGSVVAWAPHSAWVEFGAGRGRGTGKNLRMRRKIARQQFGRKGLVGQATAAGLLKQYKRPYLGPAFRRVKLGFTHEAARVLNDVFRRNSVPANG